MGPFHAFFCVRKYVGVCVNASLPNSQRNYPQKKLFVFLICKLKVSHPVPRCREFGLQAVN